MLEIVVFTTGAVVMMLEIVGSRVLAPYVGTSVFVWTSLIGVVLASLSLGYFVGGRLADKKPQINILGIIILISGLSVALTAITKDSLLQIIQSEITDLRVASVIAAVSTFALPSAFLGAVLPFAVRLRTKNISRSGTTVGTLYAISTIGSIVGTFAAGFFLVSYFGNTKLLILLSIVLLVLTLAVFLVSSRKVKDLIIWIFLIVISAAVIGVYPVKPIAFVDVDTDYNRVVLEERVWSERQILAMRTSARGYQAARFLDNDEDLVFEYLKYYRLGEHFTDDLSKVLMIGGGGYMYPRDFLRNHPDSKVDVVEIDPGITDLARKYFNLKEDPRLTIYHQDGRIFLNKNIKTYNAIFNDIFRSGLAIPFQLTTLEAVQRMHDSLKDEGIVILNTISAIEGAKGKFLRAELATYKKVFPQVYLFAIKGQGSGRVVQSVMLVALKTDLKPEFTSEDSELNGYLENRWIDDVAGDIPILTDDFAPVNNYVLEAEIKS